MKIIESPDPRLRQKSQKVNYVTDEIKDMIQAMVDASLEWEKSHPHELSAAMAAPQLGINKRLIIIRDSMDDKANTSFTTLVDPEIIKQEGKIVEDFEGCLSVPFIYGKVPRYSKIRVKAKLEDGTEVRIKATDAFFELDKNGDLQPVDYETRIKNNKQLFPDED